MMVISLCWSIGYTVAVPAVLLGAAGIYIDRQFHLSPMFTLSGFALAFVISSIALFRMIRDILEAEAEEDAAEHAQESQKPPMKSGS